ncbi:hypothetical protein ACP70R_000876 [Stipagrostis hirtigluma subsp. patula]
MDAAEAARPPSPPPRRWGLWAVEVAVSARCGRAAWLVDPVLCVFATALRWGTYGCRLACAAGCLIGGAAGGAVARFGCAAAARASYVVPRLAPLAVPLFVLRTLGQALIDAEGKRMGAGGSLDQHSGSSFLIVLCTAVLPAMGGSKDKEVSTLQRHPESKVEWCRLAKEVNFSPIVTCHIVLFSFFIRDWMPDGVEDSTVLLLGFCVAYAIICFVLLKMVIWELITDLRELLPKVRFLGARHGFCDC